jgi:hypothetical protein
VDQKRIDTMVENFIAIRTHIEQTEALVDKQLAPFKAKKDEIATEILKALDALGAKNIKTVHGTVSALEKSTASLSDADAFMEFVRENDLYELMDRRANGTACREYAKFNNGRLPPGVKLNTIRSLGVRKNHG